METFLEIYTDGSCHTQSRVGAWACAILCNDDVKLISGKEIETTHNRMEILAVINSLKYVKANYSGNMEVRIISDSQYVVGLVDRELTFISNHFKTKAGNNIRNMDLVKELLDLVKITSVNFIKIKAHQKPSNAVNYNRVVDKLCRQVMRESLFQ